ncbi:hypothetical protein J6590_003483 [Homalodisca vitripennis]|nr:hypothetical protein J6590_003483 [Homalodisca vitripennis]
MISKVIVSHEVCGVRVLEHLAPTCADGLLPLPVSVLQGDQSNDTAGCCYRLALFILSDDE